MGRGPPLSELEKGRILGLHEARLSVRAIARHVRRSKDGVHRVIQDANGVREDQRGGSNNETSGAAKPRGRPPVLTPREVRLIVRHALTGVYTARHLKARIETQASLRTIKRVLARFDYLVYTKMQRTLALKPQHKAPRREWARKIVTIAWEDVVFSDEKKFKLDGPDGFKFYRRDLRRPPREYVKRQMGGGSVMVWVSFSAKGKSEIAFLVGKQKAADYIYTLSEYLLPFAHLEHGVDVLLIQDNASIHTSRRPRSLLSSISSSSDGQRVRPTSTRSKTCGHFFLARFTTTESANSRLSKS
jgi:hypothetical protein